MIYNNNFQQFNNIYFCAKNVIIRMKIYWRSMNLHCNVSCINDLVPSYLFLRISKIQIIICRCWHKTSDRTCCFWSTFRFFEVQYRSFYYLLFQPCLLFRHALFIMLVNYNYFVPFLCGKAIFHFLPSDSKLVLLNYN